MLKNILIKCLNLIGREDIILELEKYDSVNEIESADIKNEVIKLINTYNFVVSAIFENYIELCVTEKVMSNSQSKIEYISLSKFPVKVIKVEDDNGVKMDFYSTPNYIKVNSSNKLCFVTYKFLPLEVKDLSGKIIENSSINHRILCYGMIAEYFAGKGKLSESEFWNKKFTQELFNLKSKKERRLKSTFCL